MAALGDAEAISPPALGWLIQGNLRSDLYQLSAERHFDNAPDRDSLAHRWEKGFRRYLDHALKLADQASASGFRLAARRKVFFALGEATHSLADFYAHTNWVELLFSRGEGLRPAPLIGELFYPQDLPEDLESGFFSIRYGIKGCREKQGIFYPPAGYRFCHENLAKDHRDRGHGADPLYPGGPTHFEAAFDLAVTATLDLWNYFQGEYFRRVPVTGLEKNQATFRRLAWG
jgi:hypothetical protein